MWRGILLNNNSSSRVYTFSSRKKGRPKICQQKEDINKVNRVAGTKIFSQILQSNRLLRFLFEKDHISKNQYKSARFFIKLHTIMRREGGFPKLSALNLYELERLYGENAGEVELISTPYTEKERTALLDHYLKLYNIISSDLSSLGSLQFNFIQNVLFYDFIPNALRAFLLDSKEEKGKRMFRKILKGICIIEKTLSRHLYNPHLQVE